MDPFPQLGPHIISHFKVMARKSVMAKTDKNFEFLGNPVLSNGCQETLAANEASCITLCQAPWFSGPISLTSGDSVGVMALRVSLVS